MSTENIAYLVSLSKIVQSFAVAIAVIIGGSWTLYTFVRLGFIQKAKAELAKLQLESSTQAIVSIDVNIKQTDRYSSEGYVLLGKAVISNKGNRNTLVDFSAADSCAIINIHFNEWGQEVSGATVNIPYAFCYYLRAGAFPFIVKVKEPGVYKIRVKSPLHPHELEQALTAFPTSEHDGFYWLGANYVVVAGVPCNK
jgi:hypothetical protein